MTIGKLVKYIIWTVFSTVLLMIFSYLAYRFSGKYEFVEIIPGIAVSGCIVALWISGKMD